MLKPAIVGVVHTPPFLHFNVLPCQHATRSAFVFKSTATASHILLFFTLFGLNYSLLLGFLCGLSVIIPYVGAIAVTIPIFFIAYFQWGITSYFWYIVIIHILIQILDGNVVVPILFSDAVNLHPLAILISILFFGTIWGIWGVFFAIPLAVLMNTLLNIWPRTANES